MPDTKTTSHDSLLRIQNLTLEIDTGKTGILRVLDSVCLEVRKRETVALVGESGAGKTSLVYSILGLLPGAAKLQGDILFDGDNLAALPEKQLRRIRGRKIAVAFQDAQATLNPVLSVSSELCYVLKLHQGLSGSSAQKRARDLLSLVGLRDLDRILRSYPHQLSGGMCQRVSIALALACGPQLLIADEPTSSLDATTQMQLINMLDRLRQELQFSMLLITHDLRLVARLADQVAVMRNGRIVEFATSQLLFNQPEHTYTKELLDASLLSGRPSPGALPESIA